TRVDFSEDGRWLVMHRGSGADYVIVAVNLAATARVVPLGSAPPAVTETPGVAAGSLLAGEVLLSTERFSTGTVRLTDAGIELPPFSAAVVR
ncbi:MAG: DUF3459 domain-containing protein, partial [Actinomycetota bacterium]|nr:DUF3459 domain-containing protein [Actinomycetota bacterium]